MSEGLRHTAAHHSRCNRSTKDFTACGAGDAGEATASHEMGQTTIHIPRVVRVCGEVALCFGQPAGALHGTLLTRMACVQGSATICSAVLAMACAMPAGLPFIAHPHAESGHKLMITYRLDFVNHGTARRVPRA